MSLFHQLYDVCIRKRVTIATAESCTSGLLASNISLIPGASSIFKGGIIAYQDSIKIKNLDISRSLINLKTSVSSEVTQKMAENVLDKFCADFSIAISGYAGPFGGTLDNPLGTVFISVASKQNSIVERCSFLGSRKSVVSQAVNKSATLLLAELKKIQ